MNLLKFFKILFIIGSFIIGIITTAIGITAFVAINMYTDNNGYFTTPDFHLNQKNATAVTIPDTDFNLRSIGPQWISNGIYLRINLSNSDYFVGIGKTNLVNQYLENVSYSRITDLDWGDSNDTIQSTSINSSLTADLTNNIPANQSIWDKSETGRTTFDWTLKPGSWTIIIMKINGSRGISVNFSWKEKIPILNTIATYLTIVGFILIILPILISIYVKRSLLISIYINNFKKNE